VSFEVHPLALLDARSQGSNYSTRAANAAACVANFDADRFFDFNDALLADQPAESTTGLSDDELIERAEGAGVTETDAVSDCIRDERFRTWVGEATDRAVAGPLPDTEVASVAETPTILVNGLPFAGPFDDATAFSQFLVQAAGASFAETSTETQAPAATDSPTPAPSTSATATPTPTATSSN
jgi:protein-disulfide isomerase